MASSSSPLPWESSENNVGEGEEKTMKNGGDGATSTSATSKTTTDPAGARRTKAMSIGNAASLFGAPAASPSPSAAPSSSTSGGDSSNADFFGSIKPQHASPVSSKSPFESIGEENEGESPAAAASNLFSGDNQGQDQGHAAGMDWLGGATTTQEDSRAQQQPQQQFYQQDYANQAAGQPQQQYPYYDQSGYAQQQQVQQSQYDPQGQISGMYYDPSQQQAYQQNIQAQAHAQPQYAQNAYQGYDASTASYNNQQQPQPQSAYQTGYEQQSQQQYYQQQPPQAQPYQGSNSYDPYTSQYSNTTPQQQQQQQVPFSAPAASGYSNQMSVSQSKQGTGASTYAASYSQSYDPYAPTTTSNPPYSQGVTKPALNHSQTQPYPYAAQAGLQQPTLAHSSTSANLSTLNKPASKDPKVNRSASSFFAELPPLPASKSRPASAMANGRSSQGTAVPPVPPLPYGHQQQQAAAVFTPPPPPTKSRTPAPPPLAQRPGSAASVSRPGSRAAMNRQGSVASNTTSSMTGGRGSVDYGSQYATYPQQQQHQQQRVGSDGRQSVDHSVGVYGNQGYVASPPPSNGRQSVDSHYARNDYYQPQQQHQQASYSQDPYGQQDRYSQQPQQNQNQSQSSQQQTQQEQYNQYQPQMQPQARAQQHVEDPYNQPYGQTQSVQAQPHQRPQQAMPPPKQRQPSVASQAPPPPPSRKASTAVAQSIALPKQPVGSYDMSASDMTVMPEQQSGSGQNGYPPNPYGQQEAYDPEAGGADDALLGVKQEEEIDQRLEGLTTSLQNYRIGSSSHEDHETPVPSLAAIAQTHEEVDVLPIHADLGAGEDSADFEPHERSITLDAYLPPSPAAADEKERPDPLSVSTTASSLFPPSLTTTSIPALSVSAPSPLSPGENGRMARQDYEEGGRTPDDEREAEMELQNAEREVERQVYAEDGAELDMLADPEGGNQMQAGNIEDPYASSYDPYGPPAAAHSSVDQGYHSRDPYAGQQYKSQDPYGTYGNAQPQQQYQQQPVEHDPYASSSTYDPYGQQQPAHTGDPYNTYQQQQPEQSSYDPYGPAAVPATSYEPYQQHASSIPEQQQEQPPYNPYAAPAERQYTASPSSHLANGQQQAKRPPIPVVSFGFNGRLVTFFPSASSSYTAQSASYSSPYGDSTASTSGSKVIIRKVSDLLPSDTAVLEAFPGPLFMDTNSVNASGKAKKKKEVMTWLDAKIEEAEKGSGYIGSSSNSNDPRVRETQEQAILLKLVKVMLENDGKLSGSPKIDEAVRNSLLPHLATSSTGQLPTGADLRKDSLAPSSTGSSASSPTTASAQPADLDTIQTYLLQGDKREAVRYALDHKLWAHALVIAAGVDKELQASVTKEFIQAELAGNSELAAAGREPLKVAYSMLSGAGASSIQEFIPPRSLLQSRPSVVQSSLAINGSPYTPLSRSSTPVPGSDYPTDIPNDVLAKWRETAAMIIANRGTGDSQALTSLGDALAANGWLKAAHACYLLSPQSSPLGGPGVPGVRYSLLGGLQALQQPTAGRDIEAIMLTEVVEFALSFVPVAKGQEVYVGLPHLQAYRIMHALELSDLGMHAAAQKYCDALGATLKLATKASPFYHPALLAQVKELSDRLSLVSFQDKSGSWISRKVQRPTLDNVWSTLEGRFTKFVAGEAEPDPAEALRRKAKQEAAKGVAGPFAHYSSITTPSGPDSLSRNASSTDLNRATPPPQPTSVPNTVTRTATAKQTHHRRSSSYGYGPYGADPYPPFTNSMPDTAEEAEQPLDRSSQQQQPYDSQSNEPQYGYVTPQNDTGWWSAANGSGQQDSPYGGSSSYGQTPMYSPVADGYAPQDANGLMSPMSFGNASTMVSQNQTRTNTASSSLASQPPIMEEEDDDELGLGNASNKRTKDKLSASEPASGSQQKKEDEPAKADAKKDEHTLKPAASSSWLGRIFKRDGGSPQGNGPVKAKLGEQTSFVYDPVEKRWVNKKAGADTPPPAAVVPPPRAQTASPTTAARGSFAPPLATPPAPALRASTASPPVRSSPAAGTPPPPAPAAGATPPAPRPASAAAPSGELPPPPKRPAGGKKNVRSRYVDVFAQQQEGQS